ncbi:MAG: hypothetical protein C4560_10805 [Nitrospiraceae bacterium]|nr:MAG: hypothetical protein C4560_10805 [Nitrospiraceae bacterium]
MISPRPYRPISYDNRTALEVLTDLAGKNEINREVVRALIALNRKDKPHFKECVISKEKRGAPPKLNNYRKTVD